jgi:hypothetical protein
MTAANIAGDAAESAADVPDVGSSLRGMATATVGYLGSKVSHTVERWIRRLDDVSLGAVSEPVEVMEHAGVEGVSASLQGKNPVWAAIKGGWSATSVTFKVVSVLVLVLVLLLAPVLLVLLLLGLLVAGVIAGVRAAAR